MAIHKGFSLLEIIISILLSSIILTLVMEITFRVTKQDAFAKRHVDKDVKLMVLHKQLLQDISGLCALIYEEAQKGDEKNLNAKPVEKAEKKDGIQSEDLRKYFYSVNKDTNLDFFTFVTTNSLRFYGQKAEPLVRVTYRLAPGKESAGLSLLRKETTSLDYKEAEKSGKFATILDGINKCEATYFYVKPQKQEKQSSEKGQKAPDKKDEKPELPELASEKEWGVKKAEEKESQEQKIPRYILLHIECENGIKQDLWYEIPFVFEGIAQLPKMTPGTKSSESEKNSEDQGAQHAQ